MKLKDLISQLTSFQKNDENPDIEFEGNPVNFADYDGATNTVVLSEFGAEAVIVVEEEEEEADISVPSLNLPPVND